MEKKAILEALKDKNSALCEILNSAYDGIYIVDRNRKIIFWNKGAEKITGYSEEDVLGSSCMDDILNHIDENGTLLCKLYCPLLKCMEEDTAASAKVYPLHKTGKRFPIETNIAPIKDDEGNIIAGIEIFRDISEREQFRILQEKFNTLVKKYISTATYDSIIDQVKSNSGSTALVKDLTIMHMDIVGFTTFSEANGAQEAVSMLNNVFGICEVITKECFGDIDKFVGDALLAVFTDANDAVKAARTIVLEALPNLNKVRKEEEKEEVSLRIGLNSGQVIQGDIGTVERKDVTVIGDVVNTAQRIESLCPPNSIFISESTFSRLSVENIDMFKSHGEVELKGKSQPIQVYKLVLGK